VWAVREFEADPLLPECNWEVFLEGTNMSLRIVNGNEGTASKLGLTYAMATSMADTLNNMVDKAAYNAARVIN